MTTPVTTYVALLRGINVGPHNQLPMARLRDLLAAMGGTDPRTLLRSGNAVFGHQRADPAALAARLTGLIADECGLTVPCVVRELTDLRRVIADNPFADTPFDPARLVVFFLPGPADTGRLAGIDRARYAPDEFRIGAREIYAHFPNGQARSKLPGALDDKRPGATATARNWNTVTKLAAMTHN